VLRALTEAGHEAIGVDVSSSMLKIAKRTAPSAKLIHASLYDVDIPSCDAVFAIGEPLNYGEHAPPLKPLFRKIARALRPGGLFAFDVIVDKPGKSLTRKAFATGDDWAVLVDTKEDAARKHLVRDVTTFVKVGKLYSRDREVHHVRVFRTAEIKRALEGFSVRVSTSYGDHALAVRRRAFMCRRR
jgi:SAM-dependent methyltransferase